MDQLSDHLYLFPDTCNVYAIVNDEEAVLVDFGDGGILSQLAGIGVRRVTDVLVTHHHRDQAQGLHCAVEAGARVWVPYMEQDLFVNADAHWQGRQVHNNYDVRQDRFSLLESLPVAGMLCDYDEMKLGRAEIVITLTVLPTPGHTPGSLSLLAKIDGQCLAFTGDLIYGPGQVWSLAATQWTYNGAEGAAASIASLLDLRSRGLHLLLPSHGEPVAQPAQAIDLLVKRLWELLCYRRENPRLLMLAEHPYLAVTPHLLWNRTSEANSYVLLSESGKALIVDYGYDFMTGMASGSDRSARRPWLYSMDRLKRDFGVQKVDVVLPTHYHDDHVAGINLLRQVEGTQVWAAENYADILQRPSYYDLPCLWYDPIPADRVLPLGCPVRWEEYEIHLDALPGHTRYAVSLGVEADGHRVLFTGDQYQGADGLMWNYVYQNRFDFSDYRLSLRQYQRFQPDLILSGHWEPLWVQPGYLESIQDQAGALERLHRELLPGVQQAGVASLPQEARPSELYAEAYQVAIHPYQASGVGGEPLDFEVEVTNPSSRGQMARLLFVAPRGWRVEVEEALLHLPASKTQAARFRVTPPAGLVARRARVAVDLTVGDRRVGQAAEALVTVGPPFQPAPGLG